MSLPTSSISTSKTTYGTDGRRPAEAKLRNIIKAAITHSNLLRSLPKHDQYTLIIWIVSSIFLNITYNVFYRFHMMF